MTFQGQGFSHRIKDFYEKIIKENEKKAKKIIKDIEK